MSDEERITAVTRQMLRNRIEDRIHRVLFLDFDGVVNVPYEYGTPEFNAAMEQYRKDKAEYDQSYSDYIQARNNTEEKVKADLEAKKRKKELAEQEKATRFANERNQLRNEALKSFPNQKKIDFLEEQKKVLKRHQKRLLKIFHQRLSILLKNGKD